jgi:hypothetical protein
LINRRPIGIDLTSDHRGPTKASDHGRRILTWAPEPLEDLEEDAAPPEPEAPVAEAVEPRPQPIAPQSEGSATAPPRRVPKRIPARRLVLPGSGQGTAPRPAGAPARPAAAPGPAAQPRPAAPPAPAGAEASEGEAKRKRGRPRGRAVRRQVHFHVDPQEEQLLMEAVEAYGSQQKALIAALAALKETATLHDEIDRLRDECTRQRRLLHEAQALFKR